MFGDNKVNKVDVCSTSEKMETNIQIKIWKNDNLKISKNFLRQLLFLEIVSVMKFQNKITCLRIELWLGSI